MTNFLKKLFDSLKALVKDGVWPAILGLVLLLSLLATGITLGNETANQEPLEPAKMAFSLVIFLLTLIVIIGVPAIGLRLRAKVGDLSFPQTFTTILVSGLAMVAVAIPALGWAMLVGEIKFEYWFNTLGTVKAEVWVLALLVALAQTAFKKEAGAAAASLGLIALLTFGPLIALGITSLLPGTKQEVVTRTILWPEKATDEVDPATGYPKNPECSSGVSTTRIVAPLHLAWPALQINPVVLVSESVGADVISWTDNQYDYPNPHVNASDALGGIVLAERAMQLAAEPKIVIDECKNLEIFGTPYINNGMSSTDPEALLKNTESGYLTGLTGQGIMLALTTVGWFVIRRTRKN
jgi:hypothetical protein